VTKLLTALVLVAGAAALLAAAGCTDMRGPDARARSGADLADTLREEALKLPTSDGRDRLVTGLVQLRDFLNEAGGPLKADQPIEGSPHLPAVTGGAQPAPAWATMFAPANLVIGFFTRSRDFDGKPGDDGLEVRLQPMDQFGDPTKAVGSFRIEVYQYDPHSTEKRGERLGHWFIALTDIEANRKYYDSVDRSYVLPLLWEKPIPAGTSVVVQATFYPPAGFSEKLFAQRVIKIGAPE
jgi:hypothetical protein